LKSEWLHPWTTPPPPNLLRYAGVDPALGEGDLQSIATIAYDLETQQGYLVDVWSDHVSFPQFLKQLQQLHTRHQYTKVYVESNAFQQVLMYLPELRHGIPVVGTHTDRDKERRFISMSAHFEAQRILVHPRLTTLQSEFWTEWVQFPRGQYDDALDAVEIVSRNVVGMHHQTFSGVFNW
jgi:predicted phage terminase large subunit-like protein